MNTYRDLSILTWSAKHCSRARFIFKMEDSVFLNPFLLLKFINENENDRIHLEPYQSLDIEHHCPTIDARLPLLYGFIHSNENVLQQNMITNEQSENLIISEDEYPCDIYPKYLDSNAYLMSNDARDLILCTIARQSDVLLPLSNIYITGILPEYLNIERQPLVNYQINNDRKMSCENFFTQAKGFACITNIKSSTDIYRHYYNYWQIIVNSQMENTEK
jgi:hypothetical protein